MSHNPWYRLLTTIIGMTTTDCWKAHKHKLSSTITACEFAEQLAFELLNNNFSNNIQSVSEVLSPMDARKNLQKDSSSRPDVVDCRVSLMESRFSPLTEKSGIPKAARNELLWYKFTKMHQHVQTESYDKEGKKRRYKCSMCHSKTMWRCKDCNKAVCTDDQGGCNRMCYRNHIKQKHPTVDLLL